MSGSSKKTGPLDAEDLAAFERGIVSMKAVGHTHVPIEIGVIERLIADERARNYATRSLPQRPGIKRAAGA